MILDTLENASQYVALNPRFAAAFDWLRSADPDKLEGGSRVYLDDKKLYVIVDHKEGRGRDGARMETHQHYIDIQFATAGTDEIGWRPAQACTQVSDPYNPEKDTAKFSDPAEAWVAVPPGSFAIFFPGDGHAPLGGTGEIRKLVVKVAVEG